MRDFEKISFEQFKKDVNDDYDEYNGYGTNDAGVFRRRY